MMVTAALAPPQWGRYLRHLEGGDFSLEANTDSVPEGGHFYLLRNGQVLLQSDDFSSAEAAYKDLCREHWEGCLGSECPVARFSSAWGLLGLDPKHQAAAALIRTDGTPADRRRLESNANRLRAQERRNNRGSGPFRRPAEGVGKSAASAVTAAAEAIPAAPVGGAEGAASSLPAPGV
jgi:hypothetical protein